MEQYIKIQSVLTIPGFFICEFAHSLKFICNHQSSTLCAFMVVRRRVGQVAGDLSWPMCTFPAAVDQGTICLLVSALMLQKVSSSQSISYYHIFLHLCAFCW